MLFIVCFFWSFFTTTHGLVSGDLRCARQVAQYCGKVSKRFNVATEKWEDGLPNDKTRGCWNMSVGAPPPPNVCVDAFPELGVFDVTAVLVGNATLTYCTADLANCTSIVRRPIFACVESVIAEMLSSFCCPEIGQYPPAVVNASGVNAMCLGLVAVSMAETTSLSSTTTLQTTAGTSLAVTVVSAISLALLTTTTSVAPAIVSDVAVPPNDVLPIAIGVSVGAVFLLVLIAVAAFFGCRKRKSAAAPAVVAPQPSQDNEYQAVCIRADAAYDVGKLERPPNDGYVELKLNNPNTSNYGVAARQEERYSDPSILM
jgi:hypothetical protein